MIQMISSIFKYSFLTLTILVLSHIIEVKGVTLSNHVLHAMNSLGKIPSFNPQSAGKLIKDDYARTIATHQADLNKLDAEVTADDQKALNHVIEKAQDTK